MTIVIIMTKCVKFFTIFPIKNVLGWMTSWDKCVPKLENTNTQTVVHINVGLTQFRFTAMVIHGHPFHALLFF